MNSEGPTYTKELKNGALSKCQNLLEILNQMREHGLFASKSISKVVMYADDQYINQEGMKFKFMDVGLDKNLKLFSNGQEVIENIDFHL